MSEKVPTYDWQKKKMTTEHDKNCIYSPIIQKIIDE